MLIRMPMRFLIFALLLSSLLSTPAVAQNYKLGDRLTSEKKSAPALRQLNWDELIAPGWDPMQVFKGLKLDKLKDEDPRAMEALERMKEEWRNAPPNPALNGLRVRIPGFLIPLDGTRTTFKEFLLVPYFGACIHSPPPPANQAIHVVVKGKPVAGMRIMEAVWVEGDLSLKNNDTVMGATAYHLQADKVSIYTESKKTK